jgi:transposase-like protein
MARKGYPLEFRRRALELVAAGTVAAVARLLEVSDQSIYTWRRQELIDRGELPGLSLGGARGATGCAEEDQGARDRARRASARG